MRTEKLGIKISVEKDGEVTAERCDDPPFLAQYWQRMCINPSSPYIAKLINGAGKVLSTKRIDFFEADLLKKIQP